MVSRAEKGEDVTFISGKIKGIEWIFSEINYVVRKIK